jgi:methylglutamate dehydrogenase subunit D
MAKHHLPVRGTTSDGANVTVSEVDLGFLTQIAGWQRFEEAAERTLRAIGLSLPSNYRTPVRANGSTVWRIAPDKALIRSEAPISLEDSEDIVVLDLSQARVRLTVEGTGAASLLSRLIALDFSEVAFPADTFVQTSLHHVGILVERRAREAFTVYIPTTWAVSLMGLVEDHLVRAA